MEILIIYILALPNTLVKLIKNHIFGEILIINCSNRLKANGNPSKQLQRGLTDCRQMGVCFVNWLKLEDDCLIKY